jgi:hypothetical protein
MNSGARAFEEKIIMRENWQQSDIVRMSARI